MVVGCGVVEDRRITEQTYPSSQLRALLGLPARRWYAAQWLSLFVIVRVLGAVVAASLLVGHHVGVGDRLLAVLVLVYGALSAGAAVAFPAIRVSRLAWSVDAVVVLAFLIVGEGWRSPFYVLALTTLIYPCTQLPRLGAVVVGGAYTLGYFVLAILLGVDVHTLESTPRLESFVTHLMVPMVVTLALAHSSGLLRKLRSEQDRSARLAVASERRRIARELHDSAKQRIHAAHLLLTATAAHGVDTWEPLIEQALIELDCAGADMDTSLSELHAPLLDGRLLAPALRQRAAELATSANVITAVRGEAADLPPMVAAHAYRIGVEALTNAMRHSRGGRIDIDIDIAGQADLFTLVVSDDGIGLPADPEHGRYGIRSMHQRATSLGGSLRFDPRLGGGTVVRLEVPLNPVWSRS